MFQMPAYCYSANYTAFDKWRRNDQSRAGMMGVKRSIFKCLYLSHLKHVSLAFVAVLSFFVFL